LIWSVVGYVRIRLSGENVRTFFDECIKKEISLKNILSLNGVYRADVLSTNLKTIVSVAKKCNVEIGVEGRFGLAMKVFIYRNRLAFFITFLILFVAFCVNSFFIKDVVIKGNNYLTDRQLNTLLSECGISQGKFIPSIKPHKVQGEMLQKCNILSWIWVDIKGTVARVEVREKVSKPDFFDSQKACNIVAEKDGIITEAISETGILYAKSGSFVRKGELLIGGVYDSNEYAPVRLVHASGKIYAKTTYTLHGDFPLSITTYKLSDKTQKSCGILIADKAIEINFKKRRVLGFEKYSKEKYFKLFGKFSVPLGFTNKKYCEIIKTECKLDKETAVSKAVGELTERLYSKLPPDAQVINTTRDISDNPDGTVSATVTLECIEDIASELPIVLSE